MTTEIYEGGDFVVTAFAAGETRLGRGEPLRLMVELAIYSGRDYVDIDPATMDALCIAWARYRNSGTITAPMRGPMQPVHPCREMPTRSCPAVYGAVCGERLCARFESDDVTPWLPEIANPGALK